MTQNRTCTENKAVTNQAGTRQTKTATKLWQSSETREFIRNTSWCCKMRLRPNSETVQQCTVEAPQRPWQHQYISKQYLYVS